MKLKATLTWCESQSMLAVQRQINATLLSMITDVSYAMSLEAYS